MFDAGIFSGNLCQLRKAKGLSQKALAEALYLSTQAISKWERAEALPDISHVCRLAELLQVSVDALLGVNPTGAPALIAVDGGGTKTEFVLIATDGTLLKRLILPDSNPNTRTAEGACDIFCRGIDALLQEGRRVLGIYVGGAGLASGRNGQAVTETLRRAYPHVPIRCDSDIRNLLALADDPDNAIAVICGTGSVVYASREGKLQRFGGGGWKLETQGSGYDLGRAALLAALEHRDGTGPQTLLTELVEQKLGGSVWEHVQALYAHSPAFLASFAPLVMAAWRQGDPTATEIVMENCQRIAYLVRTAANCSPKASQALFGGSILTKNPDFYQQVTALLPAGLRPTVPDHPQIWGACVQCARLFSTEAPNAAKFMLQYSKEE